jgi:hypothetical protein
MTSLTLAEPSVERSAFLSSLASFRALAFLILLLLGFEVWAHVAYNTTFLFSPFNLPSIAVSAIAPLLLALGQNIVIISGRIDLSVDFAASVFGQCLNRWISEFRDFDLPLRSLSCKHIIYKCFGILSQSSKSIANRLCPTNHAKGNTKLILSSSSDGLPAASPVKKSLIQFFSPLLKPLGGLLPAAMPNPGVFSMQNEVRSTGLLFSISSLLGTSSGRRKHRR